MAREQNRGMGQSDHTLWALLKRGRYGVFHWYSRKHMHRHVLEFCGRFNAGHDTMDQINGLLTGMVGKRLTYKALVADNDLPAGARATV